MVNLLGTPIHFAERFEDWFDHDGFLELGHPGLLDLPHHESVAGRNENGKRLRTCFLCVLCVSVLSVLKLTAETLISTQRALRRRVRRERLALVSF